jgi:hypothetical protein
MIDDAVGLGCQVSLTLDCFCHHCHTQQADFTAPKGYPASPDGSWLGGSSERQLKAVSLGAKLTTGMEIMAARLGLQQPAAAAAADAGASSSSAAAAAAAAASNEQQQSGASLAANPAWQSYLSVLQASGYFDGELQGSARYRQLLAAAQEAFVRSEAFARSTAALAAPKQRLQTLLAAVDDAAAAGASASSGAASQQQSPLAAVLDVAGLSVQEDGDEWMAAEAEQLQQQLEQAESLAASQAARKQQRQQDKQQQQGGAPEGVAGSAAKPAEGSEVDAEQLLSGLKGFVQHLAGPEGAEVPAVARPGAAAVAGASNGSRAQAAAATAASSAVDRELDLDGDAVLHELLGFLDAAYAGELGDGQPEGAGDFMAKVQALQHHMEQAMQGGDGDGDGMAGLLSKLADLPSDDYGSSDESSDDEGDSFYGADSDSEDAAAADAAADALLSLQREQAVGEPMLLPVPPPVSQRPASGSSRSQARGQQQHQQHQQHQQQQQQSNQPGAASSLQGQRGWQQKLQDWDVITAPDSDDDEAEEDGLSLGSNSSDDGSSSGDDDAGASTEGAKAARTAAAGGAFHDSYSAAMEAELAATTMARTFERVQLSPPPDAGAAGGSDAAAAAAGDDGDAAALTPLDMDYNLIKSMVSSYSAQGGLPGPASNLAGLLGLSLPTEMEVVEEDAGEGEVQQ